MPDPFSGRISWFFRIRTFCDPLRFSSSPYWFLPYRRTGCSFSISASRKVLSRSFFVVKESYLPPTSFLFSPDYFAKVRSHILVGESVLVLFVYGMKICYSLLSHFFGPRVATDSLASLIEPLPPLSHLPSFSIRKWALPLTISRPARDPSARIFRPIVAHSVTLFFPSFSGKQVLSAYSFSSFLVLFCQSFSKRFAPHVPVIEPPYSLSRGLFHGIFYPFPIGESVPGAKPPRDSWTLHSQRWRELAGRP